MSAHARIEPLQTVSPRESAPATERAPRTPLSVVPAPVPRSGPGVLVLCVALLLSALAAVLVLNITLSNRQYDLIGLRAEQREITQTNERLAQQVGQLEAPQNLAARADALGMVAPAGTASVDVATGEFSGTAAKATQGGVSAAFVAPPAGEAGANRGAAGGGEIAGPRTAGPSAASEPDTVRP